MSLDSNPSSVTAGTSVARSAPKTEKRIRLCSTEDATKLQTLKKCVCLFVKGLAAIVLAVAGVPIAALSVLPAIALLIALLLSFDKVKAASRKGVYIFFIPLVTSARFAIDAVVRDKKSYKEKDEKIDEVKYFITGENKPEDVKADDTAKPPSSHTSRQSSPRNSSSSGDANQSGEGTPLDPPSGVTFGTGSAPQPEILLQPGQQPPPRQPLDPNQSGNVVNP